jgi:hypothetical protein
MALTVYINLLLFKYYSKYLIMQASLILSSFLAYSKSTISRGS